MDDMIRKYNLILNFLKFTFDKKIWEEFLSNLITKETLPFLSQIPKFFFLIIFSHFIHITFEVRKMLKNTLRALV